VLEQLQVLFPPPSAGSGQPAAGPTARLDVRPDRTQAEAYELTCDGSSIWQGARLDELVPLLEWAIGTTAVKHLGERYLLFHAGAVAHTGYGLILPAAKGSGKTTLVAGLLHAGFRYLSDEVAVVDPRGPHLMPFPKSLCVKEGARAVLAPMFPQLQNTASHHRFGDELVSYLLPPMRALSEDVVAVRFVVLPQYVADAQTTLVPVSRSTAARALLGQSFNARSLGPSAVNETLVMLRRTDCFALTMGELHHAVSLVQRLFDS
jgi:HprK-related kinase A